MRETTSSCNEVNGSEAHRMAKKRKPNPKMQEWIDARKRHHLSHAQVQMARELGMNPIKLGKLDNHKQESWKMPLRDYIEHHYLKRFGRSSPDNITSVEERLRLAQQKKATRRASAHGRSRVGSLIGSCASWAARGQVLHDRSAHGRYLVPGCPD